jgi:PncC family amidohydrolase
MRIEEAVGDLLKREGLTVAVAESCTGGLIGHLLTSVSGSSTYFAGGIIAYSNRIKTALLGIRPGLLKRHGAVSESVARGMATGAMRRLKTDLGVGATGIAGPAGGTPEKPVGLVYIAVSGRAGTRWDRFMFEGNRAAIKQMAARRALAMLRDYLIQEGARHG